VSDQYETSEAVVRDHRTEDDPDGPVVRDHRTTTTTGPVVRDHRDAQPVTTPPPPPIPPIDPGDGGGGDGTVSTAEAAEDVWAGDGDPRTRDRDRDWDDIRDDRRGGGLDDLGDDIRERVEERMEDMRDRMEDRFGDRDRDRDRDREEDEPKPAPEPTPVVEEPAARPGYVWVEDHWERERADAGPVVRDHRDEISLFDVDDDVLEKVAANADLSSVEQPVLVAEALTDVTGVDLGGGLTATDTSDLDSGRESTVDDIGSLVEEAIENTEDQMGDLFGG
jgi:hypothetical protein